MSRIFFLLLVVMHGVFHLFGFSMALGYIDHFIISLPVQPSQALVWLTVGFLLVFAALGYATHKKWWPFVMVLSAGFSQFVIMRLWETAWPGTLLNAVLLAVAIIGLADIRFERMVAKEVDNLLSKKRFYKPAVITREMTRVLPPVVQHWLKHAGVTGSQQVNTVCLRQKGKMRAQPGARWMTFSAVQYFTAYKPAFIWKVVMRVPPFFYITGRDKLQHGRGSMTMKFLSLFPVAGAAPGEKLNTGSLVRYLAEICWFPAAALQPWIQWEQTGDLCAKARLQHDNSMVEGTFHFNKQGELVRFTADRYKDTTADAVPEKWEVEVTGYREFGRLRLPHRCKVTWRLKDDDFTWLHLELTQLSYNQVAA